jgi:hypothetical protein
MTERHQRYRGPDVTIYRHVEKKSLRVCSRFKSCSASEAARPPRCQHLTPDPSPDRYGSHTQPYTVFLVRRYVHVPSSPSV